MNHEIRFVDGDNIYPPIQFGESRDTGIVVDSRNRVAFVHNGHTYPDFVTWTNALVAERCAPLVEALEAAIERCNRCGTSVRSYCVECEKGMTIIAVYPDALDAGSGDTDDA